MDMEDLTEITEWLKNEKGITKLTLEQLISYVPEFEIWKRRN